MRLKLLHPEVARIPCEVCERYRFDKDWKPAKRAGKPVEREPGEKTPCDTCPKMPLDLVPADGPPRPALAVELNEQNRAAYEHYLECRAVGRFPDDPLVRRHARIIREIEDEVQAASSSAMMALLGMGRK